MKRELTEKLLRLYENGHNIEIKTGYVDNGFRLYRANENTLLENDNFHETLELGDVCFNSQVYAEYPLKEIDHSDIKVFKEIENWEDIPLD